MKARLLPAVSLLVAVLLSAGMAPAGRADDQRKAAALARARARVDSGDWEGAIKALEKYRSKHAKGEDERKEVDALLPRARGELAFETILEKYRETSKGRATVAQIATFLRKYGKNPDLRQRAENLADEARSTYARSLTDFETDDWPAAGRPRDLVRVQEKRLVRHGEQAALWTAGGMLSTFSVSPELTDWTAYDTLRFWVFIAKQPKPPGMIRLLFTKELPNDGNPFTPRELQEPCEYVFHVDFQGWREIVIPLRGRRWGKFSRRGKLDFSQVEEVQFMLSPWKRGTIEVVVDDVRLEKPER